MTVTAVKEIGFGKRSARFTDKYEMEYVRSFRVYLDAPQSDFTEADLAAAKALGLPRVWDAHPHDSFVLVSELRAQETEDPVRWVVDVYYSSAATDQSRQALDPTAEPPKVTYSFEAYRWAIDEDANGVPILNSAFDQVEGVEVERHRMVVNYTDKIHAYSEDEALSYIGTCNADTFQGRAPETWLIRDYSSEGRDQKNDIPFFHRKLTFVYDPLTAKVGGGTAAVGWALRVLDAGYREFIQSTGKWAAMRDGGQPVSQAVPLNGAGRRLPPGGTPAYLTYHPYVLTTFGSIRDLKLNW